MYSSDDAEFLLLGDSVHNVELGFVLADALAAWVRAISTPEKLAEMAAEDAARKKAFSEWDDLFGVAENVRIINEKMSAFRA